MSNLVFDESSSNREASHGYAWWFSGDTFEKAMAEERKPRKRSLMHRLTTHPGRLTILYFMMLGALSTLLLLTPAATPKGEKTTFTTAFALLILLIEQRLGLRVDELGEFQILISFHPMLSHIPLVMVRVTHCLGIRFQNMRPVKVPFE